jgi:hypothetical protein
MLFVKTHFQFSIFDVPKNYFGAMGLKSHHNPIESDSTFAKCALLWLQPPIHPQSGKPASANHCNQDSIEDAVQPLAR